MAIYQVMIKTTVVCLFVFNVLSTIKKNLGNNEKFNLIITILLYTLNNNCLEMLRVYHDRYEGYMHENPICHLASCF